MDKAREMISRVLDDKIPEGVAILSADDVAQLFTDALPEIIADMVELEWVRKESAYEMRSGHETWEAYVNGERIGSVRYPHLKDGFKDRTVATILKALGMVKAIGKEQGE